MSTPRNILYVNHEVECGGGEHSLLSLLGGLDRKLYRPQLLCPEDGPLSEAAWALDVPVHLLPMRFATRAGKLLGLWKSGRQLRGRLAGLSIDLVHANSLHAGYVSVYAAGQLGIPTVWHVRDVGYPAAARWACRRASRVIANSRATAGDLGLDHVEVVYNGVDQRFFSGRDTRDELRRELSLSGQSLLVGTVGRLDPWKGHDELLDAAALLRERHPSAVFVIVGDVLFDSCRRRHGGRRQQLEARATALGLADRVRFLGHRTDVPSVLGALDVLVHPSREPEPFGRSIVEAMAAGVPVVASGIGGIVEIVTDGEDGLLVAAGDARALGERISVLLADRSLRARLAAAGRTTARKRFSVDKHVQAVQRVYGELLRPVSATSR